MKRPEHAESWHEDDCFCLRLKRASEELMKAYMGALAPSGVTPVQHMILGKIHVCKGATLCEIAEAIGVDRSTLARTQLSLSSKRDTSSTPDPQVPATAGSC